DPLLAEGPQLGRGGPGAGLEDHGGPDLLPVRRVGDGDHGRLGHRRVLVQHFLDLPRVDVVAAPDDQVLFAVDDVEVAVLVLAGQVAGPEPAVGDGLAGGRPAAPIAGD